MDDTLDTTDVKVSPETTLMSRLSPKAITATPMTRGDWLAANGLTAQGDDTDRAGYSVDYDDNGKTSATWIAADMFDRTYRPFRPAFQARVITEADDLASKSAALAAFIASPDFAKTDANEQARLIQQSAAMSTYLDVLRERINNF